MYSFLTGDSKGQTENDALIDTLGQQFPYVKCDDSNENGHFFQRRCSNTYEVLLAAKYKLQQFEMSEHSTQVEPTIISKRPPVPCPKLPKSFHTKQTKTGNYSYADVEFRPMIITDEGAVSAPIQGIQYNKTEDESVVSPTDNLQWDDDFEHYDYEKAHHKDDYNYHTYDSQIPKEMISQMRETVIADEESYSEQNPEFLDEDYSSEYIYDTPIDLSSQREVDVSQLYAQVDFTSKKKKISKKKSSEPVADDIKNNAKVVGKKVPHNGTGKSKFFVQIPERRIGAPPPIPKPFNGEFFVCNSHYYSHVGLGHLANHRDGENVVSGYISLVC